MVATAEHTPGPWTVKVDEQRRVSVVAKYHIAHVLYTGHPADVEANARLMAAAPDLLSALRDLLSAFEGMPKAEAVMAAPVGKRIIGNARAAIARAEGRS